MIGIIAASIHPNGISSQIAKIYLRELKSQGIEAKLISLSGLPREIAFHELKAGISPELKPFQDQIHLTDKYIFSVPEYNGSFPGILKIFLDACEFPDSFKGKKAALVGISGGMFGNLRGLDHLDSILSYLQVMTLPYRVHIPNTQKHLSPEGDITSKKIRDQIQSQIRMLLEF